MGDNTIAAISDGTDADQTDVNQYRTAAIGDHVPRNASGVPTTLVGSLGTAALEWLNTRTQNIYASTKAVLEKIWVGAEGKNNTIETDGSDDIVIKRNSVIQGIFKSTGFDRQYFGPLGETHPAAITTFTGNSQTLADITGLSATITTTGRPVLILLFPSGDTSGGAEMFSTSSQPASRIHLLRDSSTIARIAVRALTDSGISIPPIFFDTPGAGTYTYKFQYRTNNAAAFFSIQYVRMVVFEL